MDRMQDGNRKKLRRLAVTERLRKFYNELLANVAVDADEFRRRVMERAHRAGDQPQAASGGEVD
jgi:hypothetical protein